MRANSSGQPEPAGSAEMTDVLRRLRVIESALGIDLDECGCTGMPDTCSDSRCSIETCPTVNNRLSQALDGSDRIQEQMSVLHHLLNILFERGVVNEDLVQIARLRAEAEKLEQQLRRSRELERAVGKIGSDLNAARQNRLAQVRAQLAQGESRAQTDADPVPGEN